MSKIGRRNRRRDRTAPSLGKYYSTAANADALADSNGFAIANFDIFAFWFVGGIAFSDVRISNREHAAGQINTSAALEVFRKFSEWLPRLDSNQE